MGLCAVHRYGMSNTFDIRAERTAKKLSQAEVAAAMGVNQSTVARWEGDPEKVKPFVIDALKRVIGQAAASEAAE
jgi:DNA-binding transcriptional regulator YiaG